MDSTNEISQWSLLYRPRKWSDVYGQDAVVKALKKRILENNYPQAICLRGPFGCGKSSIAYILAAAMMSHDENGDPNWDHPDCQSILNQTFDGDVMLLDASRWSSKDAMLDFTQSIETRPMFSKSGIRVCILEEVDQASSAAMLSLLKILESAKPFNKFILCSMEEKGVPQSVLSRCQVYQIRALSTKDIMMNLKHIMEQTGDWNNTNIPNDFRLKGLSIIASAAKGSMRSAVQFLEQCIINEAWDPDSIDELIGTVDEEKTWKILDGLLQKSKDEKLWRTLIFMKTGDDTNHFINYAIMMLSESMIYKETGVCADETVEWRHKALSSSPYIEELFYCISLHPQLTKPFIRTSDILAALAAYYQGVSFKPKAITQNTAVSEPPKEQPLVRLREFTKPFNKPEEVKSEKATPDPNTLFNTEKSEEKEEKGVVIGTSNYPNWSKGLNNEGIKVRAPKTDISSINIAW